MADPATTTTTTPATTTTTAPSTTAPTTEPKDKGTVLGTASTPTKVDPKSYTLKLPEGSLLGKRALEWISSYSGERGHSNEDAQERLTIAHEAAAMFAKEQHEQFITARDGWGEEAKRELAGGDEAKWKEIVAYAHVPLTDKRTAVHGLTQLLDVTGIGNKKEAIEFLANIGRMMSPKKEVTTGAPANALTTPKRAADILYGTPQTQAAGK